MRFLFKILFIILLINKININGQEFDKFSQLYDQFSTPNVYRTASGTPGPKYYQQQADYNIKIRLDEEKNIIYGEEIITYYNNSPEKLEYLWLQLDQNIRAKNSDRNKIDNAISQNHMNNSSNKDYFDNYDGGFKIEFVKDIKNKNLTYTINNTMMRVDLVKPLYPNEKIKLSVKWWYNINDRLKIGGRSGYEHFEDENNNIYTIAQFYPRMCMYGDIEGWQNKQFSGKGEFTLSFGNYNVEIEVPEDHLLAATGELLNPNKVLTPNQMKRLKKARQTFDTTVFISTKEEALENQKTKTTKYKKWKYRAINVRDFAFATSRKFIWDAQAVKQNSKNVLAMSLYPIEAYKLWGDYSTKAVVQTLKTYSKFTFDYPYPYAISINSEHIGMEYPMICFNLGRDENYEQIKNTAIAVIIHEVGHNYFPMIINSDERQWTWMDEGLNTFLQYITEQEFIADFPSRRGPAKNIVNYMKSKKEDIKPIMINSESIIQFGNNAYGKPATALVMLRDVIMGKELFDFAFKTYANRWKFKHPSPEDFFRTMEDASAVDLDWFWRGWFYTTDNVDISLNKLDINKVTFNNTEQFFDSLVTIQDFDKNIKLNPFSTDLINISKNNINSFDTTIIYDSIFDGYTQNLILKYKNNTNLTILGKNILENLNSYKYNIEIENKGGLIMPLILRWIYEDGSIEDEKIPVEVWLDEKNNILKTEFIKTKKIKKIILDYQEKTADIDISNNYLPKL